MIPNVMPTVRCLTERISCWLIFRQEYLISRLAPDLPLMPRPNSEFYVPLDDLYISGSQILPFSFGKEEEEPEDSSNDNDNNNNNNDLDWVSLSAKTSEINSRRKRFSSKTVSRKMKNRKNKIYLSTFVDVDKMKINLSMKQKEKDEINRLLEKLRHYVVKSSRQDIEDAIFCTILLSMIEKFSSKLKDDLSLEGGRAGTATRGSESPGVSLTLKSTEEGKMYFECKCSSSAPIVPVRTHSSKHRHPTLHRPPPPNLPEAPSTNSVLSSQPLNKVPSKKGFSDPVTRGQTGLPSTECLYLDEKKSVPMNPLYKSLLEKYYFHPVTRNALSSILVEDGMFLVRPSTHSQHLLTLSISNNGKIFNIVIRTREDGKFALGTKKPGEIAFFNVDEIIKFHGREAIKVEDGSLVYLKRSPLKDKAF